ncbi:MAG: hypothetical protein WCO19_04620 [Candidatus Saccharibacteria bacterium]
MARQKPVRSYNTLHNKKQTSQSVLSSRIVLIAALALAGGVVFFSGRFYLAEKNASVYWGTNNTSGSTAIVDSSPVSNPGGETPANICTGPLIPVAACTSLRSIESKGLIGNPLVATSFPNIPDTAALIVDDVSWGQSSDSSATVKMAAFYNGIVDRVLLQLNLQGSNWVVTSFTQL